MICNRLSIKYTVDCISLSELDLVAFLEMVELPSNEGIVVWISICSNERSTPVSVDSELAENVLANGWEEIKPMLRILKRWNVALWNIRLLQDFELGQWWWLIFGIFLLERSFFFFSGLIAAGVPCFDLTFQSFSSCGNRLPSAVESKREQYVLASLSLVSCCEFSFCHREAVA